MDSNAHSHSYRQSDGQTQLDAELQRLEGTARLYRLFDTFLEQAPYDSVTVDQDEPCMYLPGSQVDELVSAFTETYGDTFLEQNPELSEEDIRFYQAHDDTWDDELVEAHVYDHIADDTYFTVEGTDTPYAGESDNACGDSGGMVRTAAKAVGAAGLTLAGITGIAAADTSITDADGDGLSDTAEIETYGTDPENPDTDGDGLPDGYEVHGLADADPLQMDVFLEVDAAASCNIDPGYFDRVVAEYADAPVENPDGSTGINLQITYSNLDLNTTEYTDIRSQENGMDGLPDLKETHFDADGTGSHYAVIVPNATNGGENASPDDRVLGVAQYGQFLVTCDDRSDRQMQHTFIHETGHSVGLSPDDFTGVDSDDIPFKQYPSAMNYNDPENGPVHIGYSNGSNGEQDHDDWTFIVENLYTPDISSDELDQAVNRSGEN